MLGSSSPATRDHKTRPEMPVETKLNGVDVCVFGRRAASGCRLNRRLSKFMLVRNGFQF